MWKTEITNRLTRKELIMGSNVVEVLMDRRNELRRELNQHLQELGQTQQPMGNIMDAAIISSMGDSAAMLVEETTRRLEETERAIERVQNGGHSICRHCGGKISLLRLSVVPAAEYCVHCQRHMEKHKSVR